MKAAIELSANAPKNGVEWSEIKFVFKKGATDAYRLTSCFDTVLKGEALSFSFLGLMNHLNHTPLANELSEIEFHSV